MLRYDDGATQTIQVRFPDWCGPGHAAHHSAIGPLSERWHDRRPGRRALRHLPRARRDRRRARRSSSVDAAVDHTPGDPPIQSLPDGAHARAARRRCSSCPTCPARCSSRDDEIAPRHDARARPGRARRRRRAGTRAPVRVTLDAHRRGGGSGVEQMMYRARRRPAAALRRPVRARRTTGEHTLEYRAIDGAGQRRGLQVRRAQGRPARARRRPRGTSPAQPLGTDGWYDGAVTVTLDGARRRGLRRRRRRSTASTAAPGRAVHRRRSPSTTPGAHVLEYRLGGRRRATSRPPGRCASRSTRPRPSRPRAINGAAPVAALRRRGARRVHPHATATAPARCRRSTGSARRARGRRTPARSTSTALGALPRRLPLARPRRQRRALPHASRFAVDARRRRAGTSRRRSARPRRSRRSSRSRATAPPSAALRRGRLAVRVSCQGVDRGALRLEVTPRDRAPARAAAAASSPRASVRCGRRAARP